MTTEHITKGSQPPAFSRNRKLIAAPTFTDPWQIQTGEDVVWSAAARYTSARGISGECILRTYMRKVGVKGKTTERVDNKAITLSHAEQSLVGWWLVERR